MGTKYLVVGFTFVLAAVVGYFGAAYGYTVRGVQKVVPTGPEGENIVSWSWNAIQFLFNFATFQVDGVPLLLSVAFDVLALLVVLVIIGIVRGTD